MGWVEHIRSVYIVLLIFNGIINHYTFDFERISVHTGDYYEIKIEVKTHNNIKMNLKKLNFGSRESNSSPTAASYTDLSTDRTFVKNKLLKGI